MSLLDVLIYLASAMFMFGWVVVILDAISGFKLIERIPRNVTDVFGAIHNGTFVAIAAILTAGLIWYLATG